MLGCLSVVCDLPSWKLKGGNACDGIRQYALAISAPV